MRFVEHLANLPSDSKSPSQKLREALAMYDEGIALERCRLRRRHPELDESALERRLEAWLCREGEA